MVRPLDSDVTYLADLTTPGWDRIPLFDGRSDGTFVPVEHDGAWFGATWDMASGAVALLRADAPGDAWEPVAAWEAEPLSYGHQLHLIDGRVVYIHSEPGNGYELGQSRAFPQFDDITSTMEDR